MTVGCGIPVQQHGTQRVLGVEHGVIAAGPLGGLHYLLARASHVPVGPGDLAEISVNTERLAFFDLDTGASRSSD